MNYQHKYLKYKSKYLEKKYGYRVNFKIDNNNNDLDYKQKYLKYKSKYLDIKYGGAGATVAKPQAPAKSAAPPPVKPLTPVPPAPAKVAAPQPVKPPTPVPAPKTGAPPAHTPAPKTGAPPAHTPAQVPAPKTGAPPAAITVHISAGPGPGPGPTTPVPVAEKPKKSTGKAILNFVFGKKAKLTDKNINDKLKLIILSLLSLSTEQQIKIDEEIMTGITPCGNLAKNNNNKNLDDNRMISIGINTEIDKLDKKPARNSNMLTILETSLKNAVEPFRFINEESKKKLIPCLQEAINIVLPQYDKDYYDKHYMPK